MYGMFAFNPCLKLLCIGLRFVITAADPMFWCGGNDSSFDTSIFETIRHEKKCFL